MKTKRKSVHIPKGHCGNPNCKHVWTLRVEKPAKCPKCFGANIYVE